ncbi:MAG TPA: hypothetical protein DDZ51_26225 [Planctomycetaceae bacterium]|nr:hypothetical protein [Planctomycetaceae bacterium]
MNPYAPAAPVIEPIPEPQKAGSGFKPTWTLLIDLIITGIYLIGLDRVSVHYQAFYFNGESSAFFTSIANDFTLLGAIIVLTLAVLGGQPQGYSKNIRFFAMVICIAFAFHFPTGQFTFITLLRATVLGLAVFPMILFGHSIPHSLTRAWIGMRGKGRLNDRYQEA